MKNKKIKLLIIVSVIVVLFLIIVVYENSKQDKVCFNKNCFYVEIAGTLEQRTRGLMYRDSLDENSGMLFVFPQEDIYLFWMKNVRFPLDIIWLNSNQEVVYTQENIPSCNQEICPTITPLAKAKYVLEINAGTVDKIGLGVGDKVEFYISQ
ncbi:MAG: DUF192 domain-containing protein [Candidatus Nanoarchaeia archaeon]